MSRRLIAPLVLALTMLHGAVAREDNKGEGDAKKLQGNWELVSLEVNGAKEQLPPEEERPVVFKGDKVTTGKSPAGSFKLGSEKGLKTIDLTAPTGDIIKGIYELKGDMLTLCYAMPGGDRPKELSSKNQRMVAVLKRGK